MYLWCLFLCFNHKQAGNESKKKPYNDKSRQDNHKYE